jgi:uncharacterized protein (UPF0297 family)
MKELKNEMKIRLAKVEDLDQVLKVLNDVTLDLQKKGYKPVDLSLES